jgi:signal peptidase II
MAPLIFFGGGVVVLDQLTKLLVIHYLPLFEARVVIPGFFNLLHVHNTGAAFSMLAGANSFWRQTFFVVLTVFVLAILLYVYTKANRSDHWTRISYALICGGAVGNLIDRLRFGEVIDFLDFYIGTHHWPVFNIADSAISVGAFMLLISLLRGK